MKRLTGHFISTILKCPTFVYNRKELSNMLWSNTGRRADDVNLRLCDTESTSSYELYDCVNHELCECNFDR